MKKDHVPLIHSISKDQLTHIMKSTGLQGYIFDPSLFSVEWNGLKYQMRILGGTFYLVSIVMITDVPIYRLEKHQIKEYNRWLKMRKGCLKTPC